LEMVGDRVEQKRVRVVRRYAADMAEGHFDAGELRKAFINFLINALEASPDGSELEVSIDATGDGGDAVARVAIRDVGKGMEEETLRRLFEPFYTTKAHGTGLGMAIAKKIVDLHKGRIEVRSRVGTGTTVTVLLPLAQVAVEAVTTEERP